MKYIIGLVFLTVFIVISTLPTLGIVYLLVFFFAKEYKSSIPAIYVSSVVITIFLALIFDVELEGGIFTAAFLMFTGTPLIALFVFISFVLYKKYR